MNRRDALWGLGTIRRPSSTSISHLRADSEFQEVKKRRGRERASMMEPPTLRRLVVYMTSSKLYINITWRKPATQVGDILESGFGMFRVFMFKRLWPERLPRNPDFTRKDSPRLDNVKRLCQSNPIPRTPTRGKTDFRGIAFESHVNVFKFVSASMNGPRDAPCARVRGAKPAQRKKSPE